MSNQLTGSGTGLRKSKAVNHIVETGLKNLKQDQTGDSTGLEGCLKVTAELALENSILETQLLLLGKRRAILGNLAA